MSELNGLAQTPGGAPIHLPVLRDPIVEILGPALAAAGSVYVDLTCGLGGHASAILAACPQARLLGIDQDASAIAIAEPMLTERFGPRVRMVQARFDQLDEVCTQEGITQVQAILADLGLSSLQIDQLDRGFAYAADAPLDMRMDHRAARSAADIVNSYSVSELTSVFTRYGEQPAARRIAEAIVREREKEPFVTSGRLVGVITQALPAALRARSGHPAKRIFQALRIEVNDELAALRVMLPQASSRLEVGGRMAVLAYHSLEDRLVKHHFAELVHDQAPTGLPVVPVQYQAQYRLLTRGAVKAGDDELTENPRAASARLRVIERIERRG